MKFKVGDKVRILDTNFVAVKVGDIGTVTEERSASDDPANIVIMDLDSEYWAFEDHHLELVKEQQTMNYLMTKNSINLMYDGKTQVVSKGDNRFAKVVEALREKRFDDVKELVEPKKYFEKNGMTFEDGEIRVGNEQMPTELIDRLAEYKESDLPADSLLKFWDNLKLNPSFNSRKELFKFLENKGHSLTEDGHFIGYRGVRNDFKDKHSGKFDNSPGKVCEVPRSEVDDNPNNTCSYGLHVGGFDYAKDFGSSGKLVLVKVNPKDVVTVPNDYNGQKMRVCRFEVIEEVNEINKEIIFKSGYLNSEAHAEIEDTFDFEDDEEINEDDINSVLSARDSFEDELEDSLVDRIKNDCPWLSEEQINNILDNN